MDLRRTVCGEHLSEFRWRTVKLGPPTETLLAEGYTDMTKRTFAALMGAAAIAILGATGIDTGGTLTHSSADSGHETKFPTPTPPPPAAVSMVVTTTTAPAAQ